MLNVIVKCDEKASYVKVEGRNIIVTPNISEASKFEEHSLALSLVLDKARKVFREDTFCACRADSRIFGDKPRNIIKEEDILSDTYFYSADILY